MKVNFFDYRLRKKFWSICSTIATALSLILIFFEIPPNYKLILGGVFIVILFIIYICIWFKSNNLEEININIEGSNVTIKKGNIFQEKGLKAIAFNEHFDTQVDDKIISSKSLNGIFIKNICSNSLTELNNYIDNYSFENDEILNSNNDRLVGKKKKYKIGTICVYNKYLLTAFSKFDKNNKACLTMPEYLEFLITFWDKVNKIYGQESVSVPIFGSGITRIKEHKSITDEDLLKIMLWTFRISEMRFKYPAQLTIIIHKDKIKKINLLDIMSTENQF